MPFRTITVDGETWRVQPAGTVTANYKDEFSLIYARGNGPTLDRRVVRYSPQRARSRELAFAELSDDDLRTLLSYSQPSAMSPETSYGR